MTNSRIIEIYLNRTGKQQNYSADL